MPGKRINRVCLYSVRIKLKEQVGVILVVIMRPVIFGLGGIPDWVMIAETRIQVVTRDSQF